MAMLHGNRYGRLRVVIMAHDRTMPPLGRLLCVCVCDCGAIKMLDPHDLRSGRVTSCGCGKAQRISELRRAHGLCRSSVYRRWAAMIDRCTRETNPHFKNYGGRGISVCARWRSSFVDFLADMGHPPTSATLERKNNDSNYEPGNCVWASRTANVRNRRITKRATLNGVTKPLAEWCDERGLYYPTVNSRLLRGHSDEESVR